ncbi:MAG: radical SAM protein [Candidatus Syntrophosphaera sp.]|nr:radical SAM protein [Candidatus Syntrophosphaera sp.]
MSREYSELKDCRVCPQACGVDRYRETGFCGAGHRLKVNLVQLHHGEEPVLSGTRGSGTIFLSHCNLHCVFCQNHTISQGGWGNHITEEDCAETMLELQTAGAHNVNLVSPTHFTPQLAEAIRIAKAKGLAIPIVWNSNAYESVPSLQSLAGLVDIYLPDFKYAHAAYALKYSSARDYPEVALLALKEMYAQVGDLETDADGNATKGVLIRHLVLPNGLAGTRAALNLLFDNYGTNVSLSLMAQYYPAARAANYPELDRGLRPDEYQQALDQASNLSFKRVFTQQLSCSSEWTPDFTPPGEPSSPTTVNFRGKQNHA